VKRQRPLIACGLKPQNFNKNFLFQQPLLILTRPRQQLAFCGQFFDTTDMLLISGKISLAAVLKYRFSCLSERKRQKVAERTGDKLFSHHSSCSLPLSLSFSHTTETISPHPETPPVPCLSNYSQSGHKSLDWWSWLTYDGYPHSWA